MKNNPTPQEIEQARINAKLTPPKAAAVIHCSARAWQQWEAGKRKMHPAFFELFKLKTGIS